MPRKRSLVGIFAAVILALTLAGTMPAQSAKAASASVPNAAAYPCDDDPCGRPPAKPPVQITIAIGMVDCTVKLHLVGGGELWVDTFRGVPSLSTLGKGSLIQKISDGEPDQWIWPGHNVYAVRGTQAIIFDHLPEFSGYSQSACFNK